MSRFHRIRAIGLVSLGLAATAIGAEQSPASAFEHAAPHAVIGAYYAGWNSSTYPVSQIPADTITHLFYAFAAISDDDGAPKQA